MSRREPTPKHPAADEDRGELTTRPTHGRVEITGVDHVQLAMPAGEEALARLFYAGVLGFVEVRKPRPVAGRGGVWFVGNGASVHLGVEEPFVPGERAHPAFVVRHLERARRRLEAAGATVVDDESGLPIRRFYVHDPFGNRIELIDARDAGFTAKRRRR